MELILLNPNHRSPNIQNYLGKNLIAVIMLKVFVCISKNCSKVVNTMSFLICDLTKFHRSGLHFVTCMLHISHPRERSHISSLWQFRYIFYEYRNFIHLLVSWSLQTFHLVLICSLQFFKQMRCADGSFMVYVFHVEESGRKPRGQSRKQ